MYEVTRTFANVAMGVEKPEGDVDHDEMISAYEAFFVCGQGEMTAALKRRSYNTVTEPGYRFFRTNEMPERINKTGVILRMLFSFICPLHFMPV